MQQGHVAIVNLIPAKGPRKLQIAPPDDPVLKLNKADGGVFKGGIAHVLMVTGIASKEKGGRQERAGFFLWPLSKL